MAVILEEAEGTVNSFAEELELPVLPTPAVTLALATIVVHPESAKAVVFVSDVH
jgi:hypothetical protein